MEETVDLLVLISKLLEQEKEQLEVISLSVESG
jgi:hypothetical protein